MWINQIFALIQDNEVKELVIEDCYESANVRARDTYGKFAIAIETTLYPVRIGDKYRRNRLYRVDEQGNIEYIINVPTEEQDIQTEDWQTNNLNNETEQLINLNADIAYDVALMQLGLE